MADRASLVEVERLVSQLPPAERLLLVAHVCEQLSLEDAGPQRVADLDAWLAECDALRARLRGAVDAVEEVRQIRQERAGQQ
ncbi:MAG: hypothetical protein FJW34_05505 [Acidobacteria bacterium]|nr:hypothetical protein [Acidobacteriota bacterium]